MAIILISFLILGIMTVTSMIRYWKNEKHYIFSENAYSIAGLVRDNSAIVNDNLLLYNEDILKLFVSTISKSLNADIIISDVSGKIIIASLRDNNKYINAKISDRIVEAVRNGEYEDMGTLDGAYQSRNYIVGVPINYGNSAQIIGAVFICTEAEGFLEFYKDILNIFLIASILTLVVSFWIVRWLSYDLTRPLRQMSKVAQGVGKGDFSKRVEIISDDEIGNLASVFNDMADSLSHSEEVRRNFIANVSHELKTPMTTISGFVDGILDGTIEKVNQERYLKIVSSEVKRLSRLVKTMLDLSRIDGENINLNFESVDMSQMVLSIMMTFEDVINRKEIKINGLDYFKECFVEADRDMMYQVIYNLVENAVKFTNARGYININMCENNDKVLISLRNSGEGIPEEDIKFVFDRFFKTDKSRSIDKKGLGLGLYIVKKIVNLHGGNVDVESRVNDYTQFNISIPKKQDFKIL